MILPLACSRFDSDYCTVTYNSVFICKMDQFKHWIFKLKDYIYSRIFWKPPKSNHLEYITEIILICFVLSLIWWCIQKHVERLIDWYKKRGTVVVPNPTEATEKRTSREKRKTTAGGQSTSCRVQSQERQLRSNTTNKRKFKK
ncbi:uncharacterized protein LOC142323943 isoform X1 [Lycorma delicatula]|uniref:uncharacterized protein LOC142323943 isoform X1 n=2 Tax=Lycorma delicatula TaxID=130591 RepID=UPI003F514E33